MLFLKKWIPTKKEVKREENLKGLHQFLLSPDLWHFHRHAVEKGVAIGFFVAFLPVPLQMVFAGLLALFLRANLPIAIALTWLNNPFTFIPINIFIYRVGSLLSESNSSLPLPPEWDWRQDDLQTFWEHFVAWVPSFGKAYFLGLIIVATFSAILGYLVARITFILFELYFNKRFKK